MDQEKGSLLEIWVVVSGMKMMGNAHMWLDLTKPTIGHFCHRSSSLDWNRNLTTILNIKGASAKVSDGGFCQIGSHMAITSPDSCMCTYGWQRLHGYLWPDLMKPTIGHLCHRSSSLDWNPNVTTILNVKGASTKVSNGGFCQIGSHLNILNKTKGWEPGARSWLPKIGSRARAKEPDQEAELKPKSQEKLEPLPKKRTKGSWALTILAIIQLIMAVYHSNLYFWLFLHFVNYLYAAILAFTHFKYFFVFFLDFWPIMSLDYAGFWILFLLPPQTAHHTVVKIV